MAETFETHIGSNGDAPTTRGVKIKTPAPRNLALARSKA
jgi:hypothetical protein